MALIAFRGLVVAVADMISEFLSCNHFNDGSGIKNSISITSNSAYPHLNSMHGACKWVLSSISSRLYLRCFPDRNKVNDFAESSGDRPHGLPSTSPSSWQIANMSFESAALPNSKLSLLQDTSSCPQDKHYMSYKPVDILQMFPHQHQSSVPSMSIRSGSRAMWQLSARLAFTFEGWRAAFSRFVARWTGSCLITALGSEHWMMRMHGTQFPPSTATRSPCTTEALLP